MQLEAEANRKNKSYITKKPAVNSLSANPASQFDISTLESQLAQLAEAQNQQNKNQQDRARQNNQNQRRQSNRADVPGNYANMGQDEMNASFGRHSGRGSRREDYYKFKRQDSAESLKLNELMRKSGDGSPREQANRRKAAGRNHHQRNGDFKTNDDKSSYRKNYMMGTPGQHDNDYG